MQALRLLATVVAVLVAPALARAGDVAMRVQDVPLGARSLAVAAPADALQHARPCTGTGTGTVLYRTHRLHGRWSELGGRGRRRRPPGRRHRRVARRQPRVDGRVRRVRVPPSGDVQRLRAYELWSRVTTRAVAAPRPRRGLARDRPALRLGTPTRRSSARSRAIAPDGPARHRPSHGGLELVHAGAGAGDRARHRGLPRARQRLERHRLQLSRRPVRHGLRGPRRRHRPNVVGAHSEGFNLGHRRRRADRELQRGRHRRRRCRTRS